MHTIDIPEHCSARCCFSRGTGPKPKEVILLAKHWHAFGALCIHDSTYSSLLSLASELGSRYSNFYILLSSFFHVALRWPPRHVCYLWFHRQPCSWGTATGKIRCHPNWTPIEYSTRLCLPLRALCLHPCIVYPASCIMVTVHIWVLPYWCYRSNDMRVYIFA